VTEPFCHLFPEWQLCKALEQACDGDSRFWQAPVVRPVFEPEMPVPFSNLYQAATTPNLRSERGFPVDGAHVYGIPDPEGYKRKYLALRPDFTMQCDDALLVLLEAKSGQVPPKCGARCKEDTYYELLQECSRPAQRGFFFIVPQKFGASFISCVIERFPPRPPVQTGVVYWEDLIELIYGHLMDQAVGEIIKLSQGIEHLRSWRKARKRV
jgi:hypothetical protein